MKQKPISFNMQMGLWLSAAAILVSASSPFSNLFLPGDNDFFASPEIILSLPYTSPPTDTTLYNGGGNNPEPQDLDLINCGGDPNVNRAAGDHSAWYRYTPTTTETVTLDTIGSNVGGDTTQFDTMIGVFLDIGSGELSQVDCNDDGFPEGGKSLLTVSLAAGRTYYFVVSSFDGPPPGDNDPGGTLIFHVVSYGAVVTPFVLSSVRDDANPTALTSVDFIITFSENVMGVDTAAPFNDFALTTSGVSGAAISGVSGSGNVYTVTVDTGSGNGTIRLDIVDNDSIVKTIGGNPLGGPGPGNGNYINGQTYTINKTYNLFLPLVLR